MRRKLNSNESLNRLQIKCQQFFKQCDNFLELFESFKNEMNNVKMIMVNFNGKLKL